MKFRIYSNNVLKSSTFSIQERGSSQMAISFLEGSEDERSKILVNELDEVTKTLNSSNEFHAKFLSNGNIEVAEYNELED